MTELLYGKVKGLFTALPVESFNLNKVCYFTDSSEEDVQPILDRLIKEDFLRGKRVLRLKHVPQYILDTPVLKGFKKRNELEGFKR